VDPFDPGPWISRPVNDRGCNITETIIPKLCILHETEYLVESTGGVLLERIAAVINPVAQRAYLVFS
jgi:hypothetical protein